MAADLPDLIIIDDDPLITDTLSFVLNKEFNVFVAESRNQARSLLRQLDRPPQLALVDLGLPPTPHRPDEGFKLIGELLAHSPAIKILILSGQNEENNAKHALALGAVEFIPKPCDIERLREFLHRALRFQSAEIDEQCQELSSCGLIGGSLPMESLRTQIRQFADTPFPVLIEGESGSGKELVAACLHRLSKRSQQPYFSLNCAAISSNLAESILFGHGKGSFTGATSDHAGYFEEADKSSLFLDEIGEMPMELQTKLLRVLENGEYQRVGETQARVSHARIIGATNRDLREEVRNGRFRSDLYHRLSVFTVNVPALRDLEQDRLVLLEHFCNFYAHESGRQVFKLDEAAERRWLSYGFPGNVRELRNIIIRLTAKYSGQSVNDSQLAAELDWEFMDTASATDNIDDPRALFGQALQHLQSECNISLDHILKEWEQAYVEAALKLTHGNISQASRLLGVNRTTLYSRMQLYEDSFKE